MERQATIKKQELIRLTSPRKTLNFEDLVDEGNEEVENCENLSEQK